MAEKNYVKAVLMEAREASEDMDDRYRAVKINSSDGAKIDLCDTAGERPAGVIEIDWDDDDIADYIARGPAIIVAGAAVAEGATVSVDASGRAITTVPFSHEWVLGTARTAATAAGDQITVDVEIRPVDFASQFGYGVRTVKTRIAAAASGFAAETTLFTLPAKAVVQTVYVDVITAEVTGTTGSIDVGTAGTSNDPDGYLDGIDGTTAGIYRPVYTNAAVTAGVLLSDDEDGAGALVPTHDETAGGDPVTASPAAADYVELVADVYVVFCELG